MRERESQTWILACETHRESVMDFNVRERESQAWILTSERERVSPGF